MSEVEDGPDGNPQLDADAGPGDLENPADPVEFVWVFLPLPHPLGLPDKWKAMREIDALAMVRKGIRYPVEMSVLVHQVPRTANVAASDLIDITAAAFRALSGSQETTPDAPADVTDDLRTNITMAEVAVAWPTERDLDEAVDAAVEAVRQVQLAVSAVTETSVRLLSRATLPPFLPVFRGVVHMDGRLPEFDSYTPVLNEFSSPVAQHVKPAGLNDSELEDLHRALFQFSGFSPFRGYVDLRREAMVQQRVDGNGRLAVVCLAAGGEVFLDTVLQLMLWEERVEPAEAAVIFDRGIGHHRRVVTQFPSRLKGSWDSRGTGAVGNYFNSLVGVRHRAVHAGHNPPSGEVDAAVQCLVELEHFVGDRLCSAGVLKRFPRTAMMFLGERGVRKRNAWVEWFERLVHDEREPDWARTFARWQALLDLELDARRPDVADVGHPVDIFLEMDPTRGVRALLHDREAMAATFTNPENVLDPSVVDQFKTAGEAHFAAGGAAPLRAAAGLDRPRPVGLVWQAERAVFPELDPFPGPREPDSPGVLVADQPEKNQSNANPGEVLDP